MSRLFCIAYMTMRRPRAKPAISCHPIDNPTAIIPQTRAAKKVSFPVACQKTSSFLVNVHKSKKSGKQNACRTTPTLLRRKHPTLPGTGACRSVWSSGGPPKYRNLQWHRPWNRQPGCRSPGRAAQPHGNPSGWPLRGHAA